MANPHQVHCLQFDFSLTSSSGEASELRASALQTWVQTTLLCVIDEVLEQVANELGLANKLSYRLGRLELDLGLIFADQSETEIARRLRAQLRTLLLEQLPSASTATHMLDANNHADRYTQHHAILQGFLQTGRLNWEHSAHPTAAHRQVLRHALTENRQTVTALADEQLEFLRSVVRDERQCTRLLRQYETSELLLVARHFLATWPPQQAELALDWISLELTRLESDADVSRCEEFWRYVLHRLEANLDKHEQQALNLATPWLLDCASRDVSAIQDTEAKTQARAIAIYHSFIEKNTRISNQARAALQQVLTHLRQPLMHTLEIETTSDHSAISETHLQTHLRTQLQTQLQNQLQAADITALSTQWQSLITDHAQALHHSYATLNAQQKAQLIAALSLQKQSELAQIIRASAAKLTAEIMQEAEQLAQIIQQEGVNLSANQLREKWCHAILTEGSEDVGAIVDSDNAAAAQKTAKLLRTTIAPHLAASDSIWQSLQIALIYQQPQLSYTRAALAAMNADTMTAPELEEAAYPIQIKSKTSAAEFENTYRDEEQQKPARKTDISQVLQQAKQTPASLPTNLRKLIQKKSSFADFTNHLSDAHRHQLMIALINSAASVNTNNETSKAAHQLLQKIENEAYQSHNIRNYLNAALQQLIESQMIDFEILRARYPTTRVGGEDGEVLTQSGVGASHQDTSNDSAGFIRSTDIEATSIQMSDAKVVAGSTENNSSTSPTNRHSRAGGDEDFGQHAAHSATDVRLQANVRPARGNPVSFDGQGTQSEIEQNSTPLDRNINENETAPTETLLNSLPFKGRVRVGMGVNWKWTALKPELKPIPIPAFPLKGKGLNARAQEWMVVTGNDLISDRISGTPDEPVQPLERVQNLMPLDSRLRGNDVSSLVDGGIDTLSNASGQEQTISRTGATRQEISDNSAGFTRPTDVEAKAIQMSDGKLRSDTTEKYSTSDPTSRHSRAGVDEDFGQYAAHSATDVRLQANVRPARGSPASFDEQGAQSKIQQNSTSLDRNTNENETAPTETLLNSLPFKGRARVGMGVNWKWTAFKPELKPIPIPAFPLKGKELKARAHERMTATENEIVSDRVSGTSDESVQQLERVQNLKPRLRGNDTASFAGDEIDALSNASGQEKATSRAGATRQDISDNSAGFTRPTDVEATAIQMGDAKLRSGTTDKNSTNNPTSRHSRESGNPVSFDEQGVQSKIQQNSTPLDRNINENETASTETRLNSLPLKGKELKARQQELMVVIGNDLISDRISGVSDESVQQLQRVQNLTPLDSRLRGNDVSSFVEGGIDALNNASHQDKAGISRAGATRQEISNNSAGFTRPTDIEAKAIQMSDAKLRSDTTENNSTNNPTSRHSRESWYPVSSDEQGAPSKIQQNSTPRDHNTNENETAPTDALLNSLPFKGRARVGMGGNWKWTAFKPELKPSPIPSFPLKGKGLKSLSRGWMTATENELISDRIPGVSDESVQQLERVQNLKPLDSPLQGAPSLASEHRLSSEPYATKSSHQSLSGNDASLLIDGEIDVLANASNEDQTTSRAGATRQDISDNSAGFTRPTDIEAKAIQINDAELVSNTTEKNLINNPTSRHSRESGNPVSFDEQGVQSKLEQNSTSLDRNINENEAAPTETLLNSFSLKGKELKARAQEWRTASENELIDDRISGMSDESVQPLERVQNLKSLDSPLQGARSLASEHRLPSGQHAAQNPHQPLRGNDTASFAGDEIDALSNASNQEQTTGRAGATRQDISDNSAGFTRPTDIEAKAIQINDAKLVSGTTENNSTNNPTSRHSRAGVDEDFGQHAAHSATDVRLQANVRPARGNPVSFNEQGAQSKFEQNSTPLDRNTNENETASTETLLNSLPFKGRARVGMGVNWKWTALKPELKPIPSFLLKGKELKARAREWRTASENDLISDRASRAPDESVQQLERVQNPQPLDSSLQGAPSLASEHRLPSGQHAAQISRQSLRWNDVSSFVDGGIDALTNASNEDQTPSRAGATRQETSNNSAGFTRPTEVEAKAIQKNDAKLVAGTTENNVINNPTSRHFRAGVDEDFGQHAAHSATDVRLQVNVRPARGNPVSFDEHGAQSEIEQNSASQDFYLQAKTRPAMENPVSFNEQREQSEETQNSTPLDRNKNENETAPTETLLNSLPFKGRARLGMGVGWKWTALKPTLKPIPIPTFPLKGKELKARQQELMVVTENDLISDRASSTPEESVQQLERVQNLKPRLRGNDTVSFVGDGIDALSNASNQEQTTGRAGATRQETNNNSAGFTRPTDVEAKSIQMGDAKLRSGTADKNSTNNPISRHSRESGNPVSFNAQREQSEETQNSTPLDRNTNENETESTETPLNSLPFKGRARVGMGGGWKWTAFKPTLKPIPIPTFPLKGKELKARQQERMTATENEIVSDRASSTPDESVQQLECVQNPQPLDFPLQGARSLTSEHRLSSESNATKNPHHPLSWNDASSLVNGGIDTLANASNQEQSTSRAGATRQDTSDNSAGFTRPTNFKDQPAPASAIAHPVSFAQQGQIQSHTEQAQQISAFQEAQTSTQHEHLKSRLPQRLARALLQADLHVLDDVWEKLIHEYADLMAQSLRIYLKRPELRQNLIDAHTPEKMLELLQVMSPNLSLLLRECWDNWSIFSGFVDDQNKSALQRRSLILVWQAVFDLDLARQTSLAQVRQLIALLLTQKKPTTKKLTTSTTRSVDAPHSSSSAIRQVHYLMQIEALHHRVSASDSPLWHSALTHMLRMDSRIAQLAVLEHSDKRDEDTALISHEEVRQTLLMELSHQDRKELSIAVSSLEREMQAELGEPFSPSSTKKSLAVFLQQEQAYPRAAEELDGWHGVQTPAQAQAQDRLEQLTLLAQTTRRLSAAEEIRLGDLFTHLLANAISNHSLHARLQQELHAMLEHDAVIDRICLCLSDVTLERVFVLLQADLLEPARRLASIIKSALAIDLYQQADFFHVQAWRLIYRAAYGVSSNTMQAEIDLPSTVAADSVHARHFQSALLNEIVAHYGLGSVSSCCKKLRQASVATVAKQSLKQTHLHDIHGSSTPQAHTTTPLAQTNRPTTKSRSAFAEAEQGEVDAYVLNAGLVIVAPYVQRLFGLFELTRDGAFVDEAAAQRAVHLLQYIVTGESATPEYQLSLNKLLCGIHGGVPIIAGIEITEHEKEVIAQMLQGVIAHWSALGNTTIAGLRQTFLARQGQLRHEEDAWHLKIPQSTFDMLLDRLPWSFAMIKFPWMPEPLHVSWRT